LAVFDAASLDCYEDLLNENDQDLYQWISGQAPCPPHFSEMIEDIQAFIAQARG
jgi:antitoxin CptB